MPPVSVAATIAAQKRKAEKQAAANGAGPRPALAPAPAPAQEKQDFENPILRFLDHFLDFLNLMSTQTLFYIAFVAGMQFLLSTLRRPEEFFFDKHVMDRIVENHFDSSHNTFETVRRPADIYEWGNKVLWPGLFSDNGPCGDGEHVGSRVSSKTCMDEVWPDGDGSFHLSEASELTVADLVERMDQFDWTDGLAIRQVRAGPQECADTDQLGECVPEVADTDLASRESYGYNTGSTPFRYLTHEELGTDPNGVTSASFSSLRNYEGGGFFGFIMPFFSDAYLPTEEGTFDKVTDFRASSVNRTNGKQPKYFCVRTSLNGVQIKQLCDPCTNGDGTGLLTGAVRAHVETFWNDLKRAHWIDPKTRMVSLVIQLRSNHMGVRYRLSLMFELSSLGTVFPSYDVETRVMSKQAQRDLLTYAYLCLGLVIFFCCLEGVEVANGSIGEYFQDVWNVMDWTNYAIYLLFFLKLLDVQDALVNPDCTSYMCRDAGYFDDYKLMGEYRTMKLFYSMCVCIQLLKILKFASAMIPKMGLATDVLRECAVDLLFFGITFIISMMAFAVMLYVQLGPVMEAYITLPASFISLFRALFGDFDIDEIMNNSSGYLNLLLFLAYLFIAIFIMLSMFLAILAEAQVKVRTREEERLAEDPDFRSYGVLSHAYDGVTTASVYLKSALCSCCISRDMDGDAIEEERGGGSPALSDAVNLPKQATPVNAMLLMAEEMRKLQEEVRALQEQIAANKSRTNSRPSSRASSPLPGFGSSFGPSFARPEAKRKGRMPAWSFLGTPAPVGGLSFDHDAQGPLVV